MERIGRLIVFEGVDGAGKTTLAGATLAALLARGIEAEQHSFPGLDAGTLGRFVYDIHHAPMATRIPPTSIQLLHVAAHIDAIDNRILPALRQGTWVILDRFWWSTWVYGVAHGVSGTALARMLATEQDHWGEILPHVVFLLRRTIGRGPSDKAYRACQSEYGRLAAREAKRIEVRRIANDDTVHAAVEVVLRVLLRKDPQPGGRRNPMGRRGARSRAQLRLNLAPTVANPPAPYVRPSIAPAKPTAVYDTYWRFAAERQLVFFRRMRGLSPPWTQDPVIQKYRFTNAYRASDRVSQYLIRRVIYEGDQSPRELFFRTILFKTFNRIATWERIEQALGQIEFREYSYRTYNRVLQQAQNSGQSLYSAAYIMPSGNHAFGHVRKHQNHLRLIEQMINESVPERVAEMTRMGDAFHLLRSYPMIGDFLAYQYVTDLNYSLLTDFSEMAFVVPGPGARDGIRKCFVDLGGLTEPEIIRFMADRQEIEFERLGINFLSLWGRRLQLIDCQNLFCEVDKYARLVHPEVQGISGRTRIKQRFQASSECIDYWYPPKWEINDRVATDCGVTG